MKRLVSAVALAVCMAARPSFGADEAARPANEPRAITPPARTEAPAAPASTKQDDIRALMALTGAGRLGAQFVDQMMASFKETYPNVPDSFWKAFVSEIKADKLADKLVPIYDKYLTHDDIRQLIAFYRSPVGAKLIGVLPQITQDSLKVGQEWGREVAEAAAARMEKEGYTK